MFVTLHFAEHVGPYYTIRDDKAVIYDYGSDRSEFANFLEEHPEFRMCLNKCGMHVGHGKAKACRISLI